MLTEAGLPEAEIIRLTRYDNERELTQAIAALEADGTRRITS